MTSDQIAAAILRRDHEFLFDCYDVDDNPAGERLDADRLRQIIIEEIDRALWGKRGETAPRVKKP